MKKAYYSELRPRTITVAELCEALEKGTLAAEREDDMFIIRHPDLLRLTNPLPMRLPVAAMPTRKAS